MYLKIPHKLVFTKEVNKFIEALDGYTYRKTNRFLRNALEFYLRPRIRVELSKLWSENNWKLRLQQHNLLLLREQQRRGLYLAMLKHKVYPKYFQFMNEFLGDVRHIDFFSFVRDRCEISREELEAQQNITLSAADKHIQRLKAKRESDEKKRISFSEPKKHEHPKKKKYKRTQRPDCDP